MLGLMWAEGRPRLRDHTGKHVATKILQTGSERSRKNQLVCLGDDASDDVRTFRTIAARAEELNVTRCVAAALRDRNDVIVF